MLSARKLELYDHHRKQVQHHDSRAELDKSLGCRILLHRCYLSDKGRKPVHTVLGIMCIWRTRSSSRVDEKLTVER